MSKALIAPPGFTGPMFEVEGPPRSPAEKRELARAMRAGEVKVGVGIDEGAPLPMTPELEEWLNSLHGLIADELERQAKAQEN